MGFEGGKLRTLFSGAISGFRCFGIPIGKHGLSPSMGTHDPKKDRVFQAGGLGGILLR